MFSEVKSVVDSQMCTGCGACAAISQGGLLMALNEKGFLRPVEKSVATTIDRPTLEKMTKDFKDFCPGITVDRRNLGKLSKRHEVFGEYVSVWQGFALDEKIRAAGSSGGVLSAIQMLLLANSTSNSVLAVGQDSASPSKSVPLVIREKADVMKAAGSRYNPVGVLSKYESAQTSVIVGKPCEISTTAALRREDSEAPVLLSFFCAGVPSQLATDDILKSLNLSGDEVSSLVYRGLGWPGKFEAVDRSGKTFSMTYEESWGEFLGRNVQRRCKICPDGCGEYADITVGDFWETNSSGYPVFDDRPGNSVVIARTERGHEILMEAMRKQYVSLASINLDEVARIQPLQVDRILNLPGRLLGLAVAGVRVPRYLGYQLAKKFVSHPFSNLRNAMGSFRRARKGVI